MSTDRYFDKFPTITYSNNTVVDITRRVTLLDKVSRNPYIFYPYDIVSNERAEQFSTRYYNDPYKSWILYLGNDIIDPYYEWYLSDEEMNEHLEMKYGSLFNAIQKVKYYRNNWEFSEDISVSAYNALSPAQRKYFDPKYGTGSNVISYTRKQLDWTLNTNKIISYTVSNTSFINNEIVDIYLDGVSRGKGQVSKAANNYVYVQHVSGYYQETDSLTINERAFIYGTESLVNTSVTEATTIVSNIEDEELVYWSAYTYMDFEKEKNEFNKSIRVIDKDMAETAVNNLTELLEE